MGKDFRKNSDNEIVGGVLAEQIARHNGGRCLTDEEISQLIDGTNPPDKRDQWISHLASCDRCSEVFTLSQDLLASDEKKIIRWRRPLAWAASFLVVIVSLYVFFDVGISPTLKMKEIPMEEEAAQPEATDESKSLEFAEKKIGDVSVKREKRTDFRPEDRARSKKSYSKTGPAKKEVFKNLPKGREFDKMETPPLGVEGKKSPVMSRKGGSLKKDADVSKPNQEISLQTVQKRQTVEMEDRELQEVEQKEREARQVTEVNSGLVASSPGRRCFTPYPVDGVVLNVSAKGTSTEILLLNKHPGFSKMVLPEIPKKIYAQYLRKKVEMEILMDEKGEILRVCVMDGIPAINAHIAEALLKCQFVPPVDAVTTYPIGFHIVVFLSTEGPIYKN